MFHASRRTTVVASLAFAATTALGLAAVPTAAQAADCLLYTSDAADE